MSVVRRLWVLFLIAFVAGCSTTPIDDEEEAPLAVARADYAKTFDAAIDVATDAGMQALVRDRDGGIIETRPRTAASLMEPWYWPEGDFNQVVESTIMFQRRRTRFEFVPAGFVHRAPTEEEPLQGRRVPGTVPADENGAVDLTTYQGPLELRVWVFIERAFTPGLQRSRWTLTRSSYSTNPLKDQKAGDGTTRDRSIWTPIGRDKAVERNLMEKLKGKLTAEVPTDHDA